MMQLFVSFFGLIEVIIISIASPKVAKDACYCEYTMVVCALVSNQVITCSCLINIVNSYQFQLIAAVLL